MSQSFLQGVSGVILAGGKSSRYGRNKALVEVEGVPLVERALRVMEGLFSNVVLITNTPHTYKFLNIPMYEDRIKGLGPLGGIFTGLNVIKDNVGFFVACDMPYLQPDLIRYLVQIRGNFDVVVPNMSGMYEALHAVYTRGCLPEIESFIRSGGLQVVRFFDRVSVLYVEEKALRKIDPELRSFFNINRPEELP